MFIAQAYKALHEFWRYLVGSVLIFVASGIGQIPLTLAILGKLWMDNDGNFEGLGNAMGSLDQATLMGVLDKNLTLFLLLLSFVFALGGVFLAVKYLHQQKMKDIITTRKKFDWGRVWFAFIMILWCRKNLKLPSI